MKLKAPPFWALLAVLLAGGLLVFMGGPIFALDFLPSGVYRFMKNTGAASAAHRINDGTIGTVVIPVLGHLLNYVNVLLINGIDCLSWPISFVPGINRLLYRLYTAPDIDFVLGLTHRSFITHSPANPLFLFYIYIIRQVFRRSSLWPKLIKWGLQGICLIIGLSFAAHLLADTMPAAWIGYGKIQIGFFGHRNFGALSPLLSKLWLLWGGYLSIWQTMRAVFADKPWRDLNVKEYLHL